MPDTVVANPGSSGAIFATDVVTSSVNYVLQKIAYGSTGVANLVSSSLPLPVASASSGLVQISGTPTVTATAATNPWSSAPGFNLPTVSVSSGLSQVSAVQVSPTSSVAGSGLLVITSSFGLVTQSTQPITVTSGIITLSSNPTVISASSGLVQISGVPTVTATSATNPWSSAPTFNIPIVSVSSGLIQISGTPTVVSVSSGFIQAWPAVTPTSSVAGANLGPVTSSAGQLCNLSSGTVSLSSQITVTATGPVTITSGTVTLSSVPTVTATAATNPWSSAPGFNVPVVTVSSGLTQIAGTASVVSASSGFIQAWPAVTPTSSVAGASLGPVTSSAGILASLTSGTVSLSSQITVTATGPVTITSGLISVTSGTITSTAATNPWSSAPGFNVPVINVSSGLVQVSGTVTILSASSGLVQISGTPTVTATAGTNPWSSAPGFNLPVVNVSSGFVQCFIAPPVVTSNIVSTYFFSTGGAASVNVRGSASNLLGYSYFNTTATIRGIKIYNTSSAPGVGTTANVLMALVAPGSTGGGGANLTLPLPGLFASNGIGFTMTANAAATDTGAPGLNDLVLTLYFV